MKMTTEDIRNFKVDYSNEKSIEEFLQLTSKFAVEQAKDTDMSFFALSLELYKDCIQSQTSDSLACVMMNAYHVTQQKELIVDIMDDMLKDTDMLKGLRGCNTLEDLVTYCKNEIKVYVDIEVSKLMQLIRDSYKDNEEFQEHAMSLINETLDDEFGIMQCFVEGLIDDEETMNFLEQKLTDVLFKLLISYYVVPCSYDRVLIQLEGIEEKDLYNIFRFDALGENKIMLPEAIRPMYLGGFRDIWIKSQKEMSSDGKLSIGTLLSCEYCQLCISSSVSLEQLDTLVYGFKENERDQAIREHLTSFVSVIEDVNLQTLYTFKDYMNKISEDATKVLFENMEETKSKIKALVEEDKKEEINNVLNDTVIKCVDLGEISKIAVSTLNRVIENTRGVSLLLSDNVAKNMKYCAKPKQIRKFGIVVNNHLFGLSKFSEKETLITFLDVVQYLCETLIHNIESCLEETEQEHEEIIETLVNKVKSEEHSIKSYMELNRLAKKAGYDKVRQKGDHGIFKKLDGTVVVIPQGRAIGKGLNIKIQKDIERQ